LIKARRLGLGHGKLLSDALIGTVADEAHILPDGCVASA
jgi:hypothetical protein